jgi:hypothetical protein
MKGEWFHIILIACLFLLIIGCEQRKDAVVVIEKTKVYHTHDCSRVFMAKTTEMKLEDAQAKKMISCPFCRPDSVLKDTSQL